MELPVNEQDIVALKILLPRPSWRGLETDWHEFPNCTTYLDTYMPCTYIPGNVSPANGRDCTRLALAWGSRVWVRGPGNSVGPGSGFRACFRPGPGSVPPALCWAWVTRRVWRVPTSGGPWWFLISAHRVSIVKFYMEDEKGHAPRSGTLGC